MVFVPTYYSRVYVRLQTSFLPSDACPACCCQARQTTSAPPHARGGAEQSCPLPLKSVMLEFHGRLHFLT